MHVQVSLTIEIEASAGRAEMQQQIQEAGQQAMKQAVRRWEDEHRACPHCGEKPCRLEGTTRRVIAPCLGRVEVPRRRLRCQACGRRSCPANRLLAQLKGAMITPSLQETAILAGCSWPYRVAVTVLKRLSGAQISAEEIRRLSNRGGKLRVAHQPEEAERACSSAAKPAPAAQKSEQPMLLGVDGGWVCSRDQRGGMEGKVAVVCSQMEDLPRPWSSATFSWSERGVPRRPPRQRHRLAQRRYVATFGPSRHRGQQAKAAAQTLDADPARAVVVIADGADWSKKEQARHFPHATCMLAWAHRWREVSHAIMAASRAKALPEHERDFPLYWHRTSLWQGGVDQALQGLRRLASDGPAESLKPIQEAMRSLEHQRPWMGSYERRSSPGLSRGQWHD